MIKYFEKIYINRIFVQNDIFLLKFQVDFAFSNTYEQYFLLSFWALR